MFPFHTEICQAALSEKAAEDLFLAETKDMWNADAIEDRHSACHYERFSERISTTLLATCRQVYNEARQILYSTNTFGFKTPSTLDSFTRYLQYPRLGRHLKIRRVYLDITVGAVDHVQRWKAVIVDLISRFPEVHQISINIDRWSETGILGCRTPSEFENRHLSGNELMSALLEIRKLSLNWATFVISDADLADNRHGPTQCRWTLAEKQVWARYIKNSILRKDNQHAASPGLAVEGVPKAENLKPGLEPGREEE